MICEAMGTAEDLVVAGVNSQFGQQVVHTITNKQIEGRWMILYSKRESRCMIISFKVGHIYNDMFQGRTHI